MKYSVMVALMLSSLVIPAHAKPTHYVPCQPIYTTDPVQPRRPIYTTEPVKPRCWPTR